jgi:hypothetical protein
VAGGIKLKSYFVGAQEVTTQADIEAFVAAVSKHKQVRRAATDGDLGGQSLLTYSETRQHLVNEFFQAKTFGIPGATALVPDVFAAFLAWLPEDLRPHFTQNGFGRLAVGRLKGRLPDARWAYGNLSLSPPKPGDPQRPPLVRIGETLRAVRPAGESLRAVRPAVAGESLSRQHLVNEFFQAKTFGIPGATALCSEVFAAFLAWLPEDLRPHFTRNGFGRLAVGRLKGRLADGSLAFGNLSLTPPKPGDPQRPAVVRDGEMFRGAGPVFAQSPRLKARRRPSPAAAASGVPELSPRTLAR